MPRLEVLGDVPLGARTDPPGAPIVIAPRKSDCRGACPAACAGAFESANDPVALVAVADRCIAAVQRGSPPRIPEMLVSRVDVPGRGQAEIRGVTGDDIPAIDRIAEHAEAFVRYLAPVRIGGLEDVAQSTVRVVDLGLEEVALPDHRRVQPDAGAHGKAQSVI